MNKTESAGDVAGRHRLCVLPPQSRKAAAGKVGGKRRGSATLLVDDLDNLQIRSRTYRWGRGRRRQALLTPGVHLHIKADQPACGLWPVNATLHACKLDPTSTAK
jgi:hypothetical protein